MSGLQQLRTSLKWLKVRRALTRWQSAIAWGLAIDVIALFCLFGIDFAFRLAPTPRAVILLIVVSTLVWKAIRYVLPQMAVSESIDDIALLLERSHHVDSDLVAALQFDTPTRDSLGSQDLRHAVIERAGQIAETVDYQSAIPKQDVRRSTWLAAIAVASIVAFWFVLPNHANAFWNRLWFADANYPTRTVIDSVEVNGTTAQARIVEGESFDLRVKCSGVLPRDGSATLLGIETGESTQLTLTRIDEGARTAIYLAEGPKLNEPVEMSIEMGDATTEPRRIALVRRPIVELTIEAISPAYMRLDRLVRHEHYLQVMEGSAINLSVRCTNEKRMKNVWLELFKSDKRQVKGEQIAFSGSNEHAIEWQLAAVDSGLNRVVEETHFRLVIVDEDGLAPYHPIEGAIRVKQDQAPTATVATSHFVVMPNAAPTISCTATDDFGIGKMVLHAQQVDTKESEDAKNEQLSIQLPLDATSDLSDPMPLQVEHSLDLKPLKLVERNKLRIWLEVTDDRGVWQGVSAISEAIELEVANERAVLDAILRSDADAEQMLTDAIEQELGLKGER